MPLPTIAVAVDDFRLPPKDALRTAAELKFAHVELATVDGDVAPQNLTPSGRRHLSRYLDGLGLRLHALTADIPNLRFTDPRTVEERVERTCRILDLAVDLAVPVISTALGAATHPESGEPSSLAVEALRRLGEHADARGRILALRPSADGADRLQRLLHELACPAIRITLDPAALIMAGANPRAIAERLAASLALVHARDGTAGLGDQPGAEALFGEGDVDFTGLFDALAEAEFRGGYVLRRTSSQTPIPDLQQARDRLQRLLRI